MLKSIVALGALCAPALAAVEARATPAPALERRADQIECTILRYKMETAAEKDGDAKPTTPAEILDLAEATPTLFAGAYFNLTDACETPDITETGLAEALSTYLSEAEAWSSRHACELKSIYDDCVNDEGYNETHLAPSVFCTSVLDQAAEATCASADSGVSRTSVAVGGAFAAAVVAALAAL